LTPGTHFPIAQRSNLPTRNVVHLKAHPGQSIKGKGCPSAILGWIGKELEQPTRIVGILFNNPGELIQTQLLDAAVPIGGYPKTPTAGVDYQTTSVEAGETVRNDRNLTG
jgi:hypothetical protein